jgi:IclR family pca regulon transcriptional regulator
MGRVLLAGLADDELTSYLSTLRTESLTDRTVTSPDKLRVTIDRARADGYALVDQELEQGLRSIAAPIRNARGRTIAALNVSAHASRSTPTSLRAEVLPHLQATAAQITTALTHRGHL